MDDFVINLILPSRERPVQAREAIESAKDNASFPDRVSVVLCLDRDDSSRFLFTNYNNIGQTYTMLGEKNGCSPLYNEMAKLLPASLHFIFSDDVRFRTKGWDEEFEAVTHSMGSRPFALYPNDLHVTPGLAPHLAVSQSWIDMFGCLWPVPFKHFYSDTFVMDVAKRAERLVYLPDVVAEHVNFKYTGGAPDEVHVEPRRPANFTHDKELFDSTLQLRQEWAERIKNG